MKMILANIVDHKSGSVSQALLEAGFRVTKLASTASFLREGTTTMMTGVDDQQIEQALATIRAQFPEQGKPDTPQATIYVLRVNDFFQIRG